MSQSFDAHTDLLVIGSGAGGLTAALTASIEGAEALVVDQAVIMIHMTQLSHLNPAPIHLPLTTTLFVRRVFRMSVITICHCVK